MRIHKLFLALAILLLAPIAQADLARAQNLFEQGRANESLEEVERLLSQSPQDAELRFLQGIIFADLGRSQKAIEVFAGLTHDYPELPEPYNNLAVLFAEQGEFEKARDSLMAAIQTHPSYSTAHENLGDLYAKMAGIAYDRALEEDRANQSARLKLSAVNGLFSAPRTFSAPAVTQVAQNIPEQAPVVESTPEPAVSEPEIVASEPVPVPVTIPAVAQTQPEPVIVEPEPEVKVAVVTPQPEPEPEPAPVSSADDDIRDTIRAWASAWAGKDVDGYIGAYAPNFRPANGATRANWVAYRRDRLSNPSFIQVDVGDIDVEVLGETRARATFVQGYRSDTYQDQVIKTLNMSRTNAGWQITSEVSEAI
ncbi:MAG: tetratricopeptide repeat protein [Gammaproteobacteria bacterium]|nr:tetratricopeptide repeat protein [Gammaproteobacteria bacterium]MDH3767568.1 tetratricopeptide repeat protein [Gammaproteobacteria bacterium]